MNTRNSERRIIVELAAGMLTAKELASVLELDHRNAANLCSSMSGAGLLTEHPGEAGGRRGRRYSAAVAMHPRDARSIAEMIDAYGPKLVRKQIAAAVAVRPS